MVSLHQEACQSTSVWWHSACLLFGASYGTRTITKVYSSLLKLLKNRVSWCVGYSVIENCISTTILGIPSWQTRHGQTMTFWLVSCWSPQLIFRRFYPFTSLRGANDTSCAKRGAKTWQIKQGLLKFSHHMVRVPYDRYACFVCRQRLSREHKIILRGLFGTAESYLMAKPLDLR